MVMRMVRSDLQSAGRRWRTSASARKESLGSIAIASRRATRKPDSCGFAHPNPVHRCRKATEVWGFAALIGRDGLDRRVRLVSSRIQVVIEGLHHIYHPLFISLLLSDSVMCSEDECSPSCSSKREYLLAQIRQKDAIIESLLKQVSLSFATLHRLPFLPSPAPLPSTPVEGPCIPSPSYDLPLHTTYP